MSIGAQSNTAQPNRLGDLLIERKVISSEQLNLAIAEQKRRREQVSGLQSQPTALGEILIELNFVDRKQLRTTLKWQQRLRCTTFALAFVAPFLTTACGGGSSDTDSAPAAPVSSSEQVVDSSTDDVLPVEGSAAVTVSAVLSWTIPQLRENGSDLDLADIGGYEILYKKSSDEIHFSVMIDDPGTSGFVVDNLAPGEYEFMIASYDTDGVYSAFTDPLYETVN